MTHRARFTVATLALCCALVACEASAEIVFLSSGRSISVKSHRVVGNTVVLTLRAGGEVTCDRSLIDLIVPDEVPYPEPTPVAEALDQDANAPDVTALLQSTPYGEIISALSETHGVDPLLVRALIQVESNYQPRARSRKGALGLMQLMPATARTYKLHNPFDPRANIEAGVKHLKSLIDRLGNVELGLAAYNAGEGAVARFKGVPPYRETRNYVSRILSLAGIK